MYIILSVGITVFHEQHEREYYYVDAFSFPVIEWYEFVLLTSHFKGASLHYWLRMPCS